MKEEGLLISEDHHSLMNFWDHVQSNVSIAIHPILQEKVKKNRTYLEHRLSVKDEALYGINTGFGSLCNVEIPLSDLAKLQHNLVVSHACGLGDLVPLEIVKLIVSLKINNLSQGYSGVRLKLLEKLMELYNANVFPVIYQLGSLGASGDLAPLAHMSLPLLGLGEVHYGGKILPASKVLTSLNIESLELSFKEGLALLNGTQFSLAYGVYSIVHSRRIINLANQIAAMSLIAFGCKKDPFHPSLQRIRKHEGQISIAKHIFELLSESSSLNKEYSVQDPYSFRCIPQVHGASLMAIEHAADIFENEMNAVTDNPNVLDKEDLILIGGNFHAQILALPLDYLAIALSELGSISERRSFQLINGDRDLPSYLAKNPGLNSGFMICQYTAASVASQNKQFCTPASIDSIVSSKGQEDHVSMAANAGTKLYKVIENVYRLLAIEWMIASQAIDLREKLQLCPVLDKMHKSYRKIIPPLDGDRYLSPDITKTIEFLKKQDIIH